MAKLVDKLKQQALTLIVELPENNLDLAEAAVSAGAEGLQLFFETGQENKIAEIIKKSGVPVGVALAAKHKVTDKTVEKLTKLGAEYLLADYEQSPPQKNAGIAWFSMLNKGFNLEKLGEISALEAEALEAAIIPVAEQGKNLIVGDLQNYIALVISVGIPVIIPTEKAIQPSEVPIIADTGAKGLLLTDVVTGSDANVLAKAVGEYRLAVDGVLQVE